MATSELTTPVYLFAIISMASVVLVLVHFFSIGKQGHVSFAVVYIWQTVLYVLSLFSTLLLARLRKNELHIRRSGRRRAGVQVMRDTVIILCGVGSVILPLYEAVRSFACMKLTDGRALYVSKFISFVLIGVMVFPQCAFLIAFRKYKCVSGYARVLVSFLLSVSVSTCINFVFNTIRASNTTSEKLGNSTKDLTDFQKDLIFSFCRNNTEIVDKKMNDTAIAENINKYTNTFTLEFALLSFGILCPMWNIVANIPDGNINQAGDTDDDSSTENSDVDVHDGNALIGQSQNHQTDSRILYVLKKVLIFVSERSFIFSLLFVLPVLGLHVYSEVDNYNKEGSDVVLEIDGRNETLTVFEKSNYYLQTGYTYVISIMSFVAYLIARNDCISKWRVNADNVLLVLSGCGHLLLVLFETADSISGFLSKTDQSHLSLEIFFFIKVLFHYIGIYSQVMLIMKTRDLTVNTYSGQKDRRLLIKGIIIFLGVCNTERWLVNSFLPPSNLRFVNEIQNEDTLGERNWWFLTEFLYPIVSFYRLVSAMMLFEVKARLRRS